MRETYEVIYNWLSPQNTISCNSIKVSTTSSATITKSVVSGFVKLRVLTVCAIKKLSINEGLPCMFTIINTSNNNIYNSRGFYGELEKIVTELGLSKSKSLMIAVKVLNGVDKEEIIYRV